MLKKSCFLIFADFSCGLPADSRGVEEDARGDMTGATPLWNPHFIETLEGSFSSVSTATIARVGAFFRVFQDLQDLHSFAPLRTQNF